MAFRPVFKALVLAPLRVERTRTLLTVLGLALGVAVLVAIDLANESAVHSFRQTLNDVAGRAQLTVRGNGFGLVGSTLETVARTPGVAAASPLISGQMLAPPSGTRRTTETLTLFGVDLLRSEEPDDQAIRDITFELADGLRLQDLLVDEDSLILTKRFAQRSRVGPGDTVTLWVAGRPRDFKVAGTMAGSSFADALDGNVAVVDLGVADTLLARGGRLDRIDVVTDSGSSVEQVAAALEERLAGTALVERPETRGARVESMLAAFRFNLRALGHLSVLVGAFLIYNTMSVAVVRRRRAIGTLRAMGIPRGMVRRAFLAEGLMLGVVGSLIGALGGILLAAAMLGTVSQAISINFVETQARGLAPNWRLVAFSMLIGILGAVVAAWRPAMEAAATEPANTLRSGSEESGGAARSRGRLVVAAVLAAAAGLLLLREPRPGLPIAGYVASTLLLGAMAACMLPWLAFLAGATRRVYTRWFRAEGMVAAAGIAAAPRRASVAVCGLLVSIAMTISVGVMVSSFRRTVVEWMEQVLLADFYVSAAVVDASYRGAPLPMALAEAVAGIPGVEVVDPFRTWDVTIDGRPARAGAGNLAAARFRNKAADGRPMMEVMAAARNNDACIVSEAFARKFGVDRGDTVTLTTPKGPLELQIEAVYFDYSSEQGYVIFDRSVYIRYFDDGMLDSIAVYILPNADRDAVRRGIVAAANATEGAPAVIVRENTGLREFALRAFDQTFAVTHVLQLIAVLVAVLGVTTTLLAQLMDRRQEVLTLRWIGAARRRVARIVMLEASLIGLAGVLAGVPAGLALSWILIKHIMMESFGWTIGFSIPWPLVIQTAVVVFVATLAAGYLPAMRATRETIAPQGR